VLGRAPDFGHLQGRLDDAGHADRHFVLHFEDVFEETVEPVGPQMRAGRRVDKLRGNPDSAPGFAHRAFEDIAHTQFTPDPLHVYCLALVRKARIAGDDEEPSDPRQRSDDFLDHAVGEIFLLRVAAHVLEWHYRQ
jgi:hypothetical protein